jgi:hypothetical protein
MVPGAADIDFSLGGGRSDIDWAVAKGVPIATAVAVDMQAINLLIRKCRIRIMYLRNKKPLTIQKQMVLPWTMSTSIPAWSLTQ